MAELADALDSGSSEHYAHASSSLVIRITKNSKGFGTSPNPLFFIWSVSEKCSNSYFSNFLFHNSTVLVIAPLKPASLHFFNFSSVLTNPAT